MVDNLHYCLHSRFLRSMLSVVISLSLVFVSVINVSAADDVIGPITDFTEIYDVSLGNGLLLLDTTDYGCGFSGTTCDFGTGSATLSSYRNFRIGDTYTHEYSESDDSYRVCVVYFTASSFYDTSGELSIYYAFGTEDFRYNNIYLELYSDNKLLDTYGLPGLSDSIDIPIEYYDDVVVRLVCRADNSSYISFRLDHIEFTSTADIESSESDSDGIFDLIKNFFSSFFDKIIEALKSLFIPESGYFQTYFSDLRSFFEEKFGFLYAPIDILISILTSILDADGSDSGIPFPGVKWEDTYIIEPQVLSLETYAEEFPELQDALYFVTDVIMVGSLLWLFQIKLRAVLSN